MLASTLIRLGGVAAMVGGVTSATLGVLTVLILGLTYEIPGTIEKPIQKGGWELPAANMLLIGALAAIVALHALQRQRYGSGGTLAALAAFIGLVLLPMAWILAGPSYPLSLTAAVLLVGVLAASVGIVGLGVVTITAGVLPRWCGIALIVGSPPGVGILFLVSIPLGMARILPGEAVWELAGIAWIAVGYAIFRAAGRRIEQHPRVR
jgi:hypothetical protein